MEELVRVREFRVGAHKKLFGVFYFLCHSVVVFNTQILSRSHRVLYGVSYGVAPDAGGQSGWRAIRKKRGTVNRDVRGVVRLSRMNGNMSQRSNIPSPYLSYRVLRGSVSWPLWLRSRRAKPMRVELVNFWYHTRAHRSFARRTIDSRFNIFKYTITPFFVTDRATLKNVLVVQFGTDIPHYRLITN